MSGSFEPELTGPASTVGDRHLLVVPRPFDCMNGTIADYQSQAAEGDERRFPNLSVLAARREAETE